MFFVYLLECGDRSLYCGYARDLEARLREHSLGKASKYTRSRLPVRLVYSEKMPSRKAAMKREAEIKRLPRKQKLALVSAK